MRKITREAGEAFQVGRSYRNSNTAVEVDGETVTLFLHGNAIAKRDHDGLSVTLAGWPTVTTRERLDGIEGVQVSQRKGRQYLNGAEWDGDWTKIA